MENVELNVKMNGIVSCVFDIAMIGPVRVLANK
ncbi:hypothetical protein Desal_0768 [Maridesulfovibrio salexigens DSM 2638]|uniref:Uncharacterized protein n=1 Tax=Maridesulfovibrio salexigens (strain ATCC 14822 / DSM 2638 / NCIMB 8403 / VKM B-1763) TaxID=526222 RepID=C6BZ10_MARSD|nr:hypothetical protein Desal_0768 [Maridesulfovibrio salexigens DSM 2638]